MDLANLTHKTVRPFLSPLIDPVIPISFLDIVFVPWHLQKHLDSNAKLSRPKQNEEMELSQLESTISRQHEEMPENPKLVKLYRYYHVFRRDEISDLCSRALNSQILDVSFDANNWVILMEKLS